MSHEIDQIAERYQRRADIPANRYSRLNPVVNLTVQERQRALIRLFSQVGLANLADVKMLEVGCGSGANLLELIEFGAAPEHLVGNELLPARLTAARARLPETVRLLAGDAAQLDLAAESFDIVYQSTVFSSILDDEVQSSLARKMWSLVMPGGGGYSGMTSPLTTPKILTCAACRSVASRRCFRLRASGLQRSRWRRRLPDGLYRCRHTFTDC